MEKFLKAQRQLSRVTKAVAKWRRFTAKKTTGFVCYRGKVNPTRDEESHPPNTTLLYHDMFGRPDRDRLDVPNKNYILSYPYANSHWQDTVFHLRKEKKKFTDPNFPPDDNALFHDPANPKNPSLKEDVKKWVRISEMFEKDRYLKFTFFDDAELSLCGFETLEKDEFISVSHEANSPSEAASVQKAKEVCAASLCSHGPIDYSISLYESSPIKDWLSSNEIFETIMKASKPLVYKEFLDYKVNCWQEEGYEATISIIAHVKFGPASPVSLFESGESGEQLVQPGDVQQGALGDCYFLGGISVLSADQDLLFEIFPDLNPSDPDVNNREQQYCEEGLYALAFYKNRNRRIVVVDDFIPCNEHGKPIFAHPPRNSVEIWTMLAEKAYAKLNGSYEAIIGGLEKEALQEMTGGLPLSYNISGAEEEDRWKGPEGLERLWKFFKEDIFHPVERSFVGCSVVGEEIEGNTGHGILCNHAYGVMQAFELKLNGESHRLVNIRNPWGGGVEWDGDWCDDDPRWNQIDEKTKTLMGYTDLDDGTWYMDIKDFKEQFDEIQVCRLLNQSPNWTHHVAVCKWEGFAAGGTESIHLNPQFQLVVSHDTKAYIELRQPSRRQLGQEKYETAIGPVVLRNCTPHKRQIIISPEDVIGKLSLAHSRSRVMEFDLKASESPFNIICVASQKGWESEFFLEIYTKDGDPDCSACQKLKGRHTHSELWALKNAGLPLCAQCNQVVAVDFVAVKDVHVHKACLDAYKAAVAPKCVSCEAPIVAIEGKFTGRFFEVADGNKVHAECNAAYQKKMAPPCLHCNEPVYKEEGKFTGVFMEVTGGGKVHQECWNAFRAAKAAICEECKEPIVKVEGKFNGQFFTTDEGTKVHAECWETHLINTADPCIHCGKPCAEFADFSGEFFEVDEGQVHAECWDAYAEANP